MARVPRKPSPEILLKRAERLAHKQFEFDSLSPGQRAALQALLDGNDTLAILPTGGGKSAIYQLAGLVLGGLTLIVSPLVALQRDQVEHLLDLSIEAHLLNSSLSASEREAVWKAVEEAPTTFLLLAPEQFCNRETLERLKTIGVSLFVVDEAHCVSSWGHDFRPDYARLGAVHEELGCPPVLALTATAAPPVREEILGRLNIQGAQVVVAGFDRPNLRLEVRDFPDCERKTAALLDAVLDGPKPAIVYAATRAATEELAHKLSERGASVLAYHAGLGARERDERQSAFMKGEVELFVATVAFGMGVDKPDVRRVYHHDVSDSLDSYYQEAGRAGRDGEGAEAILFFCEGDMGLRRFHIGSGDAGVQTATHLAAALEDMNATHLEQVERELDLSPSALKRSLGWLEDAGALKMSATGELELRSHLDLRKLKRELQHKAQQVHEWDESRLEMLQRYATTNHCRRQFLLGYFGETLDGPCGNCDNCTRIANSIHEAPVSAALDGVGVGVRVQHKTWGEGEVVREESDALTVVFASVGYKTLARDLALQSGLLQLL